MDLQPLTWPVSATATAALLHPRAGVKELFRTAFKELLLSGAWTLERGPGGRPLPVRLGETELAVPEGRRELRLVRRDHALPPHAVLHRLDDGLRATSEPGWSSVRVAVWRLLQTDLTVLDDLRAEAERELLDRDLATLRRRALGLARSVLVPTAAGEALLREAVAREDRVRAALADGSDLAAPLTALGGLVALAPRALAAEVARAGRFRGVDVAGVVWAAETVGWSQLFAAADDAGAALDGGGGGDGGDGGGGGGDGGS